MKKTRPENFTHNRLREAFQVRMAPPIPPSDHPLCTPKDTGGELLIATSASAQLSPRWRCPLFELLSVHLPGPDSALRFHGLQSPIPHVCSSIWPPSLAQVVSPWLDSVAVSPTDLQQALVLFLQKFFYHASLLPAPAPWASLEAFLLLLYCLFVSETGFHISQDI